MSFKTLRDRLEVLEERAGGERPLDPRTLDAETWTALAILRHRVRREPPYRTQLERPVGISEQEWSAVLAGLAEGVAS